MGQLGLSVWDVAVTIDESLDDSAQAGETLIDLLGFLEKLACSSSFADSFRSCKINEIELGAFDGTILVNLFVL